jgi:hypothetical protein
LPHTDWSVRREVDQDVDVAVGAVVARAREPNNAAWLTPRALRAASFSRNRARMSGLSIFTYYHNKFGQDKTQPLMRVIFAQEKEGVAISPGEHTVVCSYRRTGTPDTRPPLGAPESILHALGVVAHH